jgi:hypothetical protein
VAALIRINHRSLVGTALAYWFWSIRLRQTKQIDLSGRAFGVLLCKQSHNGSTLGIGKTRIGKAPPEQCQIFSLNKFIYC